MPSPRNLELAIVVCFEDARRERFLMARHRERGWEIPGGRVERGEPPLEAARREFAEEIGHELLGPRLVMRQERRNGLFWVVTGSFGPVLGNERRDEAEPVRDYRFVRRIGEVAPLAFPDDPYDEIGKALGRLLR